MWYLFSLLCSVTSSHCCSFETRLEPNCLKTGRFIPHMLACNVLHARLRNAACTRENRTELYICIYNITIKVVYIAYIFQYTCIIRCIKVKPFELTGYVRVKNPFCKSCPKHSFKLSIHTLFRQLLYVINYHFDVPDTVCLIIY